MYANENDFANPTPRKSEEFLPPAACKFRNVSDSVLKEQSADREKIACAVGLDIHYELGMVSDETGAHKPRMQPFNPRMSGPACPYNYTGKFLPEAQMSETCWDPIEQGRRLRDVPAYDSKLYKVRDPRKISKTVVIRDYGCKIPLDSKQTEHMARAVLNHYPDQYVAFLGEFVSNLFGANMRTFLTEQRAGLMRILENTNELNSLSWQMLYQVHGTDEIDPSKREEDPIYDVTAPTAPRNTRADLVADVDSMLGFTQTMKQSLNAVNAHLGVATSTLYSAQEVLNVVPCLRQHIATLTEMIDVWCRGFGSKEEYVLAMMYWANEQGRNLTQDLQLIDEDGDVQYDRVELVVPYAINGAHPLAEATRTTTERDLDPSIQTPGEVATDQGYTYGRRIPVGRWSGSDRKVGLLNMTTQAEHKWCWGHPANLYYRHIQRELAENQAQPQGTADTILLGAYIPYRVRRMKVSKNNLKSTDRETAVEIDVDNGDRWAWGLQMPNIEQHVVKEYVQLNQFTPTTESKPVSEQKKYINVRDSLLEDEKHPSFFRGVEDIYRDAEAAYRGTWGGDVVEADRYQEGPNWAVKPTETADTCDAVNKYDKLKSFEIQDEKSSNTDSFVSIVPELLRCGSQRHDPFVLHGPQVKLEGGKYNFPVEAFHKYSDKHFVDLNNDLNKIAGLPSTFKGVDIRSVVPSYAPARFTNYRDAYVASLMLKVQKDESQIAEVAKHGFSGSSVQMRLRNLLNRDSVDLADSAIRLPDVKDVDKTTMDFPYVSTEYDRAKMQVLAFRVATQSMYGMYIANVVCTPLKPLKTSQDFRDHQKHMSNMLAALHAHSEKKVANSKEHREIIHKLCGLAILRNLIQQVKNSQATASEQELGGGPSLETLYPEYPELVHAVTGYCPDDLEYYYAGNKASYDHQTAANTKLEQSFATLYSAFSDDDVDLGPIIDGGELDLRDRLAAAPDLGRLIAHFVGDRDTGLAIDGGDKKSDYYDPQSATDIHYKLFVKDLKYEELTGDPQTLAAALCESTIDALAAKIRKERPSLPVVLSNDVTYKVFKGGHSYRAVQQTHSKGKGGDLARVPYYVTIERTSEDGTSDQGSMHIPFLPSRKDDSVAEGKVVLNKAAQPPGRLIAATNSKDSTRWYLWLTQAPSTRKNEEEAKEEIIQQDYHGPGGRSHMFAMLDASALLWDARYYHNPSSVHEHTEEDPQCPQAVNHMHYWCRTMVESFAYSRRSYKGHKLWESDIRAEPNKTFPTRMIGEMTDETFKKYFPLLPQRHPLRDHLRKVRALDVLWGELPHYKNRNADANGAWMPFSVAHQMRLYKTVGLFDQTYKVPRNPWCAHNNAGLSKIFNQSYHSVYHTDSWQAPHFQDWVTNVCKYKTPFTDERKCFPFSQYGGTPVEADFLRHKVHLDGKKRTQQLTYNRFGCTKPLALGQQFHDTGLLQDLYSKEYRNYAHLSEEQKSHSNESGDVYISNFMAYARNHAIIALASCNYGTEDPSQTRIVRNLYRLYVDTYECMGNKPDDDGVPAILGFLPTAVNNSDDRPVLLYAGSLQCVNSKLSSFCHSSANRNERVCQIYKQVYLNDATLLHTRMLRQSHRLELHRMNFRRARAKRGNQYEETDFARDLISLQDAYIEFLQTTVLGMLLESGADLHNVPLHLLEPRELEVSLLEEDDHLVGNDFLTPRTQEIVKTMDFGGHTLNRTQLAILSLIPPNHRILGTMRLNQATEVIDLEHIKKEIQKDTVESNKKVWQKYAEALVSGAFAQKFLESEGTMDFSFDLSAIKDPLKESMHVPNRISTTQGQVQGSVATSMRNQQLQRNTGPTSVLAMNRDEMAKALQKVRARVETDYVKNGGNLTRERCLMTLHIPDHVKRILRPEYL